MTDRTLLHAEQQMLMHRPWHAAAEGSVWEVTAEQGNHVWDRCVVVAVRDPMELDPKPCWFMASGAGDILSRMIHPDSITKATPLLLVHRDEPDRAYEPSEQCWIEAS